MLLQTPASLRVARRVESSFWFDLFEALFGFLDILQEVVDDPNDEPLSVQQPSQVQYTPAQADWSGIIRKTFAVPKVIDQTPNGIKWLSDTAWVPWNGVPIDPTSMSKDDFYHKMCPSPDTVLGLKELFEEHNPFFDIYNPSKADVDEWHRLVINHIRKLVGYNTTEYEAKPDVCAFAVALWGQERRYTTIWDEKYPDKTCATVSNVHCGDTFRPSLEDQLSYLPEGHPGCSTSRVYASSITGDVKSNIPWSINLVRGFCGMLAKEGFWGAHLGPWFRREYFGLGFWDQHPEGGPKTTGEELRTRWTGKLQNHLYPEP